jgi:hypothetical protein
MLLLLPRSHYNLSKATGHSIKKLYLKIFCVVVEDRILV